MNNGNTGLSARLRLLAESVVYGKTAADIGTDHGLVPEYLLKNGLCPHVIASDLRKGPLSRAAKRLEGLPGADLRLGPGLSVLEPGEAATILLAGMGAELIASILEAHPDVTCRAERLVLQPRTRTPYLRRWLEGHRFAFAEMLVREEGRVCEVFAAQPPDLERYRDAHACFGQEAALPLCGPDDPHSPCGTAREDLLRYELPLHLVETTDPLLKQDYVDQYVRRCETVLEELKNADLRAREAEIEDWTEKRAFARLWAEKAGL